MDYLVKRTPTSRETTRLRNCGTNNKGRNNRSDGKSISSKPSNGKAISAKSDACSERANKDSCR